MSPTAATTSAFDLPRTFPNPLSFYPFPEGWCGRRIFLGTQRRIVGLNTGLPCALQRGFVYLLASTDKKRALCSECQTSNASGNQILRLGDAGVGDPLG